MMREGEAEKQVLYVIEGIALLVTLLDLFLAFIQSFFPLSCCVTSWIAESISLLSYSGLYYFNAQKQYTALIWTSRDLTEDDLHNISITKDMVWQTCDVIYRVGWCCFEIALFDKTLVVL